MRGSGIVGLALLVAAGCGREGLNGLGDGGGTSPTPLPSPPPSSNFSFFRTLTIPASAVPGTDDLQDFPVLVAATLGTGVAHPAGWDIAFQDLAGDPLDHEMEGFDDTGTVFAWVRIPNLSTAIDTTFYVYYGDPTITAPTENPSEVWPDYVGVWHFSEDPSDVAPQMVDSTLPAFPGTADVSMTTGNRVAGVIGAGLAFDGLDDKVDVGDHPEFVLPEYQWSIWVRGDNDASNQNPNQHVLWNADSQFQFTWNHGGPTFVTAASHFNGSTWENEEIQNQLVANTWYHVSGRYDGGNLAIYLNGQSQNDSGAAGPVERVDPFWIGGAPGSPFPGQIDEVRVSATARAPTWARAEFVNASNPTGFTLVGSEQSN